jgi:hypothetical protein
MVKHGIQLILVQIDEAHSVDGWPVNLKDAPMSHTNIGERLERARKFIREEKPPFPVFVDTWSNSFAEIYRAWPDKYYCVNSDLLITHESEYGDSNEDNALIKVDCTEVIKMLMK